MCSPSDSIAVTVREHGVPPSATVLSIYAARKPLTLEVCIVPIAAANTMSYPTPSYRTHAPYSLVAHHPWAFSSPIHQKQLFLWRSGNLTSLAFLSTTHGRAVDGNHQFLCFFALPSPLRCRRVEGSGRDKMLHLFFSVLEGSFLTSERGPLLVFCLCGPRAPYLFVSLSLHSRKKNNASMYVFRD